MKPAPESLTFKAARGARVTVSVDEGGTLVVAVDNAELIASDRRKIGEFMDRIQAVRMAASREAVAARCVKSKPR